MNRFFLACLLIMAACTIQTKDLTQLENLSSKERITTNNLHKWDEITSRLVKETPLERSGDTFRLWAYLYTSQKAFADTSFEATNAFSGSIDLISTKVLQLFYPHYRNPNIHVDPFSEKLTNMLMVSIKKRYDDEERNIRPVSLPEKPDHWSSETIPADRFIPSMKPWKMRSNREFQAPPPPPPNDPYWDKQQKAVKKHMQNATDYQKERSLHWESPIDPEGSIWKNKTQEYMQIQNIPLEMQLEVRAKLTMALMDAMIAVFHDKFTYFVSRPFMRDKHLRPLFTTPNHPSYPAAHSTIASAAETILCYYFPENGKEWRALSYESSESRLWGGVHFPTDLDYGKKQGTQISNAVLFR